MGESHGTTRFSEKVKCISEEAKRETFDEKWFSELTYSRNTKLKSLKRFVLMIEEAG